MTKFQLDDLIAFNDELLALSKAGVPLELGLANASQDLSGMLSRATSSIATRMEAGATLDAALAESPHEFPPLYRGMVRIGTRSARLPAALESLSKAMERIKEMRQTFSASIIYPIAVTVVGYAFFIMSIGWASPPILQGLREMNAGGRWIAFLSFMSGTIWIWGPIPPIVAVAAVCYCRWRRSMTGHAQRTWNSRQVKWGRLACFLECLAMLLENNVQLGEALVLSAEAFGEQQLIDGCRDISQRFEAGAVVGQAEFPSSLPPLARWLLANRAVQRDLPNSIRDLSQQYHQRAVSAAQWYRHTLPMWLTLSIGGTVTLTYAIVVFGPWIQLLWQFGMETY